MRRWRGMAAVGALSVGVALGCHHDQVADEPPYGYYHAPGLDWTRVNRILVLPFFNETANHPVAEETRQALVAELQRAGRFEVVPAPPDIWAEVSNVIRESGRFNEIAMIRLARASRADVIIAGTVSQYNPYRLPRLGLVLQVVSPADAVIVASVDGLWDATHHDIAAHARTYYRENDRGGRSAPFTETLALESPQYFQRFVCYEAVSALLNVPQPPKPNATAGLAVQAGTSLQPVSGTAADKKQASPCKSRDACPPCANPQPLAIEPADGSPGK